MKKILITGSSSYVGTCFARWLGNFENRYMVESISLKNATWKEKSFSEYDVVFHVAGIAHVTSDPKMEDMYYEVNRDLTIETAKKAKDEGIKQFIFMSSIIVYGDNNAQRVIDINTLPKPSNFYGNSKLQAEERLKPLESENFKVAIIRPPMIYGKGSKGNYPKLAKLARKIPIFPKVQNQRSMLHIDNLCEFLRLIIENEEKGLYFPQNSEYVQTSEMVRLIAEVYGRKVYFTKAFNPLLKVMSLKSGFINKVFGNLAYEQGMSRYKEEYRIRNLRESIELTENKNEG